MFEKFTVNFARSLGFQLAVLPVALLLSIGLIAVFRVELVGSSAPIIFLLSYIAVTLMTIATEVVGLSDKIDK